MAGPLLLQLFLPETHDTQRHTTESHSSDALLLLHWGPSIWPWRGVETEGMAQPLAQQMFHEDIASAPGRAADAHEGITPAP